MIVSLTHIPTSSINLIYSVNISRHKTSDQLKPKRVDMNTWW